MINRPSLSVIITNFNYERFVADAIDSLLSQDGDIEIIVVDDCSTDNSRDVISRYADRVTCVFQDVNKGHGGGFNAGFEKATGDLVMFLDADDFLLSGALTTILENYEPDIAIYHYRMVYTNESGETWGVFPPLRHPLADGDISRKLRFHGRYNGTITSGLVFSRDVLSKVMPMDSERYRQGGDGYLSATVPLYGRAVSRDETISAYRLHGNQHSKFKRDYAKRARWCIGHNQERFESIRANAKRLGLDYEANLAEHDRDHLENRIISLLFEPEEHPIKGDKLSDLSEAIVRAVKEQESSSDVFWWSVFKIMPLPIKRVQLGWKIDPTTRPKWLVSCARTLRKILGKDGSAASA